MNELFTYCLNNFFIDKDDDDILVMYKKKPDFLKYLEKYEYKIKQFVMEKSLSDNGIEAWDDFNVISMFGVIPYLIANKSCPGAFKVALDLLREGGILLLSKKEVGKLDLNKIIGNYIKKDCGNKQFVIDDYEKLSDVPLIIIRRKYDDEATGYEETDIVKEEEAKNDKEMDTKIKNYLLN